MAGGATLILLAGMHRSGTSLLGSLLPCLGIPMPGELIEGDIHNPEGYYERSDITDLQETLQIELGRWWPSDTGDLPFGDQWLRLPSSVRAAQRLEHCLRSELEHQSGPWAIKDPRLSLLLPLWQQLSTRLDLPLRLVLSVRDPAEVMLSLQHRDGPLTGMTPWRAQRLIWRHLQQLLLDSAELPTLVVAYSDWFEAPRAERQLQGLAHFCCQEQPGAEGLQQALQRIEPRHRRSLRPAEELALAIHPLLQELQGRLDQIARLEPARQSQPLADLRRWLQEATPRRLPPYPDLERTTTTKPADDGDGNSDDEGNNREGRGTDIGEAQRNGEGLSNGEDLSNREDLSNSNDTDTPWFDAAFYRRQCQQRGLMTPASALEHFRTHGWQLGLTPCALADPLWAAAAPQRRELWPTGRLEGLHPWGAAALALSDGDVRMALDRLRGWLQHGLSGSDLEAIAAADTQQFRLSEAAFEPCPALPSGGELWLLGISDDDPELPQWRAHLPVTDTERASEDAAATAQAPQAAPLGLSLGPLPCGPHSLELLRLARAAAVFDPDPERVALLRRLGVNARLLAVQSLSQQSGAEALPGDPAATPAGADAPADLASAPTSGPPAAETSELAAAASSSGRSAAETVASSASTSNASPAAETVEHPPAAATGGDPAPAARRPASLRQLGRKLARKLRRASFEHVHPLAPAVHNFLFFTLRRKAIAVTQLIRTRRFASIPRIFLSDSNEPAATYTPLISVIVPNYNHAAYLDQRLESIFAQTYSRFEVLLLDDASTDGSQEILRSWQKRHPDHCRLVINEQNSGSPFRQWSRGLELAQGELIWIAESDDFCDPDFLRKLVPSFANPATMLAFAQIQFVSETGADQVWSMQHYLPEAGSGFWNRPLVSSAHRLTGWIWNRRNLIPNVSAALFRHCRDLPLLQDPSWLDMRVCGDWLFYLHLARGGLVAYVPGATSYYRQHPGNSSVSLHRQRLYLEEHIRLAEQLLSLYRLDGQACHRMQAELRQRWTDLHDQPLPADLEDQIRALQPGDPGTDPRSRNLLIVVYSLIAGGGEILPIRLANLLRQRGCGVTVLNCHQHPNQPGVRQMLRPDIPLLELNSLEALGTIVEEFGIDVVHSHHPWVDTTIAELLQGSSDVCHVITSHGMYDELDPDEIVRIGRLLRPWVKHATYVADHNLEALLRIGFDHSQTTRIANAIDSQTIEPIARSSLGISDDAFVLCLASRGIREKGWQEAIEAVQLVRQRSGLDVQLLILGDGKELQRLQPLHREPHLHFLGFQDNARRYFACADIGILPSFYPGESQPLTLIECLTAGRPYLASDLGEIRAMLSTSEGLAGQVIPLRDGRPDSAGFADAILAYLDDPSLLARHTALTAVAASRFDPAVMGDAYDAVYRKALTNNASPTC